MTAPAPAPSAPAASGGATAPVVRHLGTAPYADTWEAMRRFTEARTPDTPDELWVVEHPAVYTLGVAAREEHLPRVPNGIPVVRTDRGGQITYHGPGQAVAYLLVDLSRRGLKVRELVTRIEQAVIDLLADHGVQGERLAGAPGVYVGGAKIAALGLRVKQGCTYHGLALNVDMDLAPYRAINPCGYAGMAVTQLGDLVPEVNMQEVEAALARGLVERIYHR